MKFVEKYPEFSTHRRPPCEAVDTELLWSSFHGVSVNQHRDSRFVSCTSIILETYERRKGVKEGRKEEARKGRREGGRKEIEKRRRKERKADYENI